MKKQIRSRPKIVSYKVPGDSYSQMRATVKLIGQAIRNAAAYLPLRNHAAKLAARAEPKDYLGQVRNIWDDTLKRWRYVKDPVHRELLSFSPQALWRFVLAGDGIGVGEGRGVGDCDCIAALSGAQLYAIGMPVRLATTAPPGSAPGRMYGHVFVQVKVPKHGWLTFDPVLHPKQGLGAIPAHSRIAYYDLQGRQLGAAGNITRNFAGEEGALQMSGYGQIPDLTEWTDYGLGGEGENAFTEDLREPDDWRLYGMPYFGAYVDMLGYIDGCGMGIAAEVQPELYGGRALARTPMLELTPRDYRYVKVMRRPYHGMMALGDTGDTYEYDGQLGFFKRIWGGIKKVARKVKSGAKKLLSKTRTGRYLLKIGKKVMSVAKKIVRPLARFVGKYAAKLAPVAALIPGWGPAISAGLYGAGKIANLMNKYDVAITGAKGKVRNLAVKGDPKKRAKKMKEFQRALKKAARKEAERQKKGGKIKRPGEKKRRGKKRQAKEIKRLKAQLKAFRARGGQRRAVSPMPRAKVVSRGPAYMSRR